MNSNDTYVGQIDLLGLVGAKLEKTQDGECIVIPVSSNPSIYRRQTQKGQQKAELDFVMRPTSNGLNGNTHFVKVQRNILFAQNILHCVVIKFAAFALLFHS